MIEHPNDVEGFIVDDRTLRLIPKNGHAYPAGKVGIGCQIGLPQRCEATAPVIARRHGGLIENPSIRRNPSWVKDRKVDGFSEPAQRPYNRHTLRKWARVGDV